MDGKEWRIEHLLSLAGVYQPAKEIEKSKVPAALARALKMHPEVKTIVLHLDNDRIGRLATKKQVNVLFQEDLLKLYTILKEMKLLCHYHIDNVEIPENRLDF